MLFRSSAREQVRDGVDGIIVENSEAGVYDGLLRIIEHPYYEAAKVDGANFWQRLWNVTLPMMRGAIMINLVFGVTYGLKVFDIVYVLTNGGPGHATEVMTTYSYQLYGAGQYGLSTAFNAILLFITAMIGILIVRVMSRKEAF